VIDSAAIAQIFASMISCWAFGFFAGKAVAWTRALSNAA